MLHEIGTSTHQSATRLSARVAAAKARFRPAPGMGDAESVIEFSFEGKNYAVPLAAYKVNLIVLPDGRILEPSGWLESFPPQPQFDDSSVVDGLQAQVSE